MKKQGLSLLLVLLLCLTLLPTAALAAAPTQQPADVSPVPGKTETVTPGGGEADNDELFAGYLESSVFSVTPKKRGGFTVNPHLSGNDATAYSVLRPLIEAVAAGTETSTVFVVSAAALNEKTYWSAADLGVSAVVENGAITDAASEALMAQYAVNHRLVLNALLSDCPYSFYWFGGSMPCSIGGIGATYDYNAREYVLYFDGGYTYSFSVASDYSAGDYTVDASKVNLAKSAAQKAQDFVAEKADLSDADKLLAYKNRICDLVSYNYAAVEAAAQGDVSAKNPWQMVWVFDEDPNTNVVCEGYSKAFKYLCDLSSFQAPVKCITVTGKMDSGDHMWNIVSPGDGCNYLVDVTNCDGDETEISIGYPDLLFMTADATGSVADGYVFDLGFTSTCYTYDTDTLGLYDEKELTLGRVEQGEAVLIKQAQAILDGKPALCFTFTVPEGFQAEGAVARFSGSGRTLDVLFTQAAAVDGRDYIFDYRLSPKEYRDTVTVKLFDSAGKPIALVGTSGTDYTDGLDYSLESYVTKMKASADTSPAMRALANGIDAYCTAAQLYYGYHADGLSVPNAVTQVTAAQLSGFEAVLGGSLPTGITGWAVQLDLEDNTALRVVFSSDSSVAPENYTFKLNGVRVYPERNADGSYCLEAFGIPADELDTQQVFSVAYGGVSGTVLASALSCAYDALVNNATGTLADLSRALYLYNSAANVYFGGGAD